MTAPMSGFQITLDDDGTAWLSAADADGRTWAIERRRLPLSTVRHVTLALGADAYAGLQARVHMIQRRLESVAATEDARVREARERLEAFNAEVEAVDAPLRAAAEVDEAG
jgi:hypothetical protein